MSIPLERQSSDLYVDFAASYVSGAIPDGSIYAPFNSLQAAMDYINARPSSEFQWKVHVCPASVGLPNSSLPFTIPEGRGVVIEGAIRTFPGVGVMTITPQFNGFSATCLRNIFVEEIIIKDSLAGPGSAQLVSENAVFGSGGIHMDPGSVSDVFLQIGGINSAAFENGSSVTTASVDGPININGSLYADSTIFSSTLTLNGAKLTNCTFYDDITCLYTSGNSCEILDSSFNNSKNLNLSGTAIAKFDDLSTYNFKEHAWNVVGGGGLVRDHNLSTYALFTNPPTFEGQGYTITAQDTYDLAKADSPNTCAKFAGVWLNDDDSIATVHGKVYPFRFEPGLTLAAGDIVYVSPTTAGLFTNIKPVTGGGLCIKRVGYIVDPSMYNSLDVNGSVAFCLSINSVTENDDLTDKSETVILASLNNPGYYFPNQYVGPFFNTASDANVSAFGAGSGFYRVPKKGQLTNFCWTTCSVSGSPILMDLYIAPSLNIGLLAYSGITLTLPDFAYSVNNTDILNVEVDDIIVAYNSDPFVGYTSSNLMLTAEFKPLP